MRPSLSPPPTQPCLFVSSSVATVERRASYPMYLPRANLWRVAHPSQAGRSSSRMDQAVASTECILQPCRQGVSFCVNSKSGLTDGVAEQVRDGKWAPNNDAGTWTDERVALDCASGCKVPPPAFSLLHAIASACLPGPSGKPAPHVHRSPRTLPSPRVPSLRTRNPKPHTQASLVTVQCSVWEMKPLPPRGSEVRGVGAGGQRVQELKPVQPARRRARGQHLQPRTGALPTPPFVATPATVSHRWELRAQPGGCGTRCSSCSLSARAPPRSCTRETWYTGDAVEGVVCT